MIIDSHQHFWVYDAKKHSWIDDSMSAIRKDFLPLELKKIYQENGIDGCVAIQTDQSLKETEFLLKLSAEHQFIKGVVGWVDLCSDKIEEQLEVYSNVEKIKGFRHIVQAELDPDFLNQPNFTKGISALERYNFTYDILVLPHQLGATLEFVKKFPNQKFIIDHIAKPNIKEDLFDEWASLMKEIAKCAHVYCKLSGMVTEADHNNWTPKQIEPYMDLVLNSFGTDRLLFGSDWPVCLAAGNYYKVKKLTTDFIAKCSPVEQRKIMGDNAMKFYNL
ncbi:amidohydrolase family protein [Cellulophaga sp. Z1A5H]|uniref:amidohydrolase family protein n=1 Tax=Cellulophaga sp. Z1A5H TaxID=2687291 RepID=UPI0013FD3227|nr:amidohydrolase family protein [Cellulophaga sp. Z1A5H]